LSLDTTDPAHLRVAGYVHPRLAGHDLAFSPDGRTVWVSSAASPYVTVYDAADGRAIAAVPAGAAPQHVAFSQTAPAHAYIASGYGRSLELVDVSSRRVLHRATLPYGSFNLSTLGSVVATTSLLDGKVSVFDAATLGPRLTAAVAPEAREIVLIRGPHAAGRPIPDYIGRYATSGRLADGGRARLSSNGNVHIKHGSKAALLTLRPWGTVTVACADPTTAATLVLSRYARGESAQVQTVRSRPAHPFALVPLAPLTSPVTLPHSGPPQQVTSMQLSVATEAFSVAGTILVSVQTTGTGCEVSAVSMIVSHG
jgi:hypothetical protein